MKYKNVALAVLFTASLAVAVQDFGVPPGVPNVFSAGEVAVADDVNANFDWVGDELVQLEITDNTHDLQIGDLETDIATNASAISSEAAARAAADVAHDADIAQLEDADNSHELLIEAIETELAQLGLTDTHHDLLIGDLEADVAQLNSQVNSHDALINTLAAAAKKRSQSFAARGYLESGDCSGKLFQGENDELGGGCPGWIGWMDLPAPSDWDTLTDMTVTFTLMNYVDDGQSAQDVDIDVYGDLIGSGDLAFDDFPLCFPGPDTTYDFYAEASVSVPAVQPPPPLSAGTSIPGGTPYLVSTSFTISSGLLAGGPNPWLDPKHIRVNFFEPSGPLFVGKGGGGGTDPCLFFLSGQETTPFNHELFVTIEYTAL